MQSQNNMTKRWGYIQFVLLVLLIVLGWQITDQWIFEEKNETALETALCSAGENRGELEKVLRHYQKNPIDSLKYKAACFLIENMPFYSYSDGKQLDNYKVYFACLKDSPKSPEEISDSIKKVFGPITLLDKKQDICEVDSAYLCNNIEWAFKVWQEQPWGKNISFDNFCEYVLPYRIGNEPLAYWREMYYKQYNSLLDSLRMSATLDKEDPVVAINYLLDRFPGRFYRYTSVSPFSFGHIGPKYVQALTGSCIEVTDFGIYMLRALGIPCAIDFITASGHTNGRHFWVTTWDKNGEDYMTDFPDKLKLVRRNRWYMYDITPKVYRQTFSVNRSLYEIMAAYGEDLHPFWQLPKFKEVTAMYAQCFNKELKIPSSKLYEKKQKGKIAYLCVSSKKSWVPADWTKYDTSNLVFKNVKRGAVMRVATYENGTFHFLTDPFSLDWLTSEVHYYFAGKEKQDVTLFAKSNLINDMPFRNRMVGGLFEGSNRSDFAKRDTLFIIQRKPDRLNTEVRSWSNKKYRYIRYVGPDESNCNVAEIAFYEPNSVIPIKGRVIGTPNCQQGGNREYTNVFDGKSWTSFDYKNPSGGWAGLDLGREVQVERIVYTPCNEDNYIRPGDKFELLYCDKDWKSVGIIQATADSLIYRNIPKEAILLIRNLTRGVEERIFVYNKGQQIWK